jgi:hypothetical protein
MNRQSPLRIALAIAGVLCASVIAAPQTSQSKPPRITEEHRVLLIRSLQAEHAFTKITFPQGKKGVTIKDGKVSPGELEIGQQVAREGPATNVGDRVLITDMRLLGDKIIFEFNGGPRKGAKWYQHITFSAGGPDVPVASTNPNQVYAKGSVVTLQFKDYIPDLTPEQVKELLSPVFDFTSMTIAEAYAKSLPPKAQEAIKNHQVLVGMDKDMVSYSLGRPPKRYRDKDEKGHDYEEWIYGTPPEEVKFVRFIGPTVAQLTVMKVTGEKVVKTEPEIELAAKQADQPKTDEAPAKKMKRPTLLAPGEENPNGQPNPAAGSGGSSGGSSSTPDQTSSPHFASNGK